MNPVCFPDLDAGHTGGSEKVLVLVAGERTGDAGGPLVHVLASLVSHVLVGDHVLTTLLCVAPVAYFTHVSYKTYVARADALVESKQRLADLYLATIRSLALAIDKAGTTSGSSDTNWSTVSLSRTG